ncbi:glycosyltransferase family protein [Ruegeria arenilitoris]|uniref:glycosyltransferase family protein n=1 Tax=Ruegeria arenilitoris TaxID=1173585 RepID=UPI00147CD587|nr:glycosyltransferase [Ruegeria arenilitoris]
MKVMIVVTHLLGTGHLSRALTLGRAFSQKQHQVFVVSGGLPAPQLDTTGLTLFGLPPLRSDGTHFTRLLDQYSEVADLNYMDARTEALEKALISFQPDVLITELFPFGRRALTAEFLNVLSAARALTKPPIILASIRDILAPPSKPSKAERTDEIIGQFYDAVLVHSEPSITQLSVSWPVSDLLARRLRYTGFVAPNSPEPHPDGLGTGEILVSAGGGSVGQPIFHAAIEAARKMQGHRWRLLVGGQDALARIAHLTELAEGAPVTIESVRPDFRQMLPLAAASVSMCGYNTAMDLLQTGVPAVLIPFDDGNEVEQTLRARSLAHQSGFATVANSDLNAQTLAKAVKTVLSNKRRAKMTHGVDGANKSVEISEEIWKAKQ